MPLQARSEPGHDLPPPFQLVTLREAGDAFAHGCAIAGEKGAGTLVVVRRFDLAEFAVVLEPEEALATARAVALHVGMNALADALAVHAPPERPIAFGWPDAVRIDGVLVGGARLGWPERAAEEEVPAWLVFGGMVRTAVIRASDPGLRPLLGALDELGFEAIDSGAIVASFARYLMAGFDEQSEAGAGAAGRRYHERLELSGAGVAGLSDCGDLMFRSSDGSGPTERKALREALAAPPSWLDPETGAPWL